MPRWAATPRRCNKSIETSTITYLFPSVVMQNLESETCCAVASLHNTFTVHIAKWFCFSSLHPRLQALYRSDAALSVQTNAPLLVLRCPATTAVKRTRSQAITCDSKQFLPEIQPPHMIHADDIHAATWELKQQNNNVQQHSLQHCFGVGCCATLGPRQQNSQT